jgi:hypothetical protein
MKGSEPITNVGVDCGATQISEDALHEGLKKFALDHANEIDNTAFGTFTE